ncbi:hypothetical protein L6R52_30340, partial [Myxococcota bacterium]|nr:hypothetical protein [Myxococcota bacterium]
MADLVWGWIEEELEALRASGQERLAELILDLPSLAHEGAHTYVDAVVPEALALARAAGRPWLEVYFRHWHLQSRVLIRCEGETALGEAVSLVELAHRPETKGCPQSICAVQDLACCYGLVDGPGYADERIAVTNELLPTLEPERGCFSCLSMEHASALADRGAAEDGLVYLDRQALRAVEAGRVSTTSHVRAQRARLLVQLGRFDEALQVCEAGLADPDRDGNDRRKLRALRARALVGLGRMDDAAQDVPTDEDLEASSAHALEVAETLEALAGAGKIANDVALGQRLRTIARRY